MKHVMCHITDQLYRLTYETGMKRVLYFFLRIAVLVFVWELPRGGFEFLHAGQFSHKGSLWEMGHDFDSKISCSVLKSLDGHERSPQGTDLDEKSGHLYSFSRRFRKSQSRGRFRPSQNRKFDFSICRPNFCQDLRPQKIRVRELPGGFLCENCPGVVLNFSAPGNSFKKYSIV